jgi:hypothetical protein
MANDTQKAQANLKFQELQKCKEDPIYFIKNYIYIQHPVKGRIPLKLYPFQEDCINDFLEFKYNIVVKSRQLGLSTITSAYCLWYAMFHMDKDIRLMATRLETAKNMIQKIRIAFKDVPAWIKTLLGLTETEKESVKYIEFTNGSKIEAIPTTPESVRGIACSLLIIDECVSGDSLIHLKKEGMELIFEKKIKDLWAELQTFHAEKYKVLTPSGWSNFSGIKKTERKSYLLISTENGKELKCSYEHKLKFSNGEFLEAQSIQIGDELLDAGIVSSIEEVVRPIELYDLLNVELGNEYYTNGFVSSNCAHIEKFSDIWEAARPTITTGGDAILFSSPNGKNEFYDIYKNADTGEIRKDRIGLHCEEVGTNGFHAIKLPWQVHPDRDDKWFENETKSMDAKKIDKEYCCGFEGSGNTFFDADTIEWIKSNVNMPISEEAKNNDFWIWALPESDHKYIITSDIARGDGEDHSCCHIIDVNTDEQVGEFYGKMPPDKFAELLVEYGYKYNTAKIINEMNSIGIAAAIKLRDLKYPNLYYDEKVMDNIHLMTDEERENIYPGHTTSPKIREKLLSQLENVLRNKLLKINSIRFAKELDTFIWNGKKTQAIRGKFDDAIMALSFALLVYEPTGLSANKQSQNGISWEEIFLNSIQSKSTDLSAISSYQSQLSQENTKKQQIENNLPRKDLSGIKMFGILVTDLLKD